jgi:hypothetical protein
MARTACPSETEVLRTEYSVACIAHWQIFAAVKME